MPHSPPFALFVVATWVLFVISCACFAVNLHGAITWRRMKQARRDYVVQITIRDLGPAFRTDMEINRKPPERGRKALLVAQHAAGIGIAELDAWMAEGAMEARRDGS